MAIKQKNNSISTKDVESFRGQLLSWYDQHARILPWRARSGQTSDPYHVWLSEIMLQQTTVGAVGPYFTKFIDKWPSVHDLANADQDDVMSAWAGLGYYARARNLHACAKIVANDLGGKFPEDQNALKKLPGVGDYTSAAITAIAFNNAATVVDGNIERIMARLFAVQELLPKSKPILKDLAAHFFDGFDDRPGDLAQAMMDLGAGVCIAKTPRCVLCPVSDLCEGKAQGIAETLPKKEKKKKKPQKIGHVYWIENEDGEVLFERRAEKGLLGGMLGLPTSEWVEGDQVSTPKHLRGTKSFKGKKVIHHSFTHFDLELQLKTAKVNKTPSGHLWSKNTDIQPSEFPTVFKKALNLFLK